MTPKTVNRKYVKEPRISCRVENLMSGQMLLSNVLIGEFDEGMSELSRRGENSITRGSVEPNPGQQLLIRAVHW